MRLGLRNQRDDSRLMEDEKWTFPGDCAVPLMLQRRPCCNVVSLPHRGVVGNVTEGSGSSASFLTNQVIPLLVVMRRMPTDTECAATGVHSHSCGSFRKTLDTAVCKLHQTLRLVALKAAAPSLNPAGSAQHQSSDLEGRNAPETLLQTARTALLLLGLTWSGLL